MKGNPDAAQASNRRSFLRDSLTTGAAIVRDMADKADANSARDLDPIRYV